MSKDRLDHPDALPAMEDRQGSALKKAAQLVQEHADFIASARGKRIRVLRAIVYEGPAEEILKQLALSLPEGRKVVRDLTIDVHQGPMEIVSEGASE